MVACQIFIRRAECIGGDSKERQGLMTGGFTANNGGNTTGINEVRIGCMFRRSIFSIGLHSFVEVVGITYGGSARRECVLGEIF